MRLHWKLEDSARSQPRAGRVRKGSEEFFRTDWVLESDPAHKSATRAASLPAMSAPSPQAQGASVPPGFVPLALNAPSADIRIELRQGDQLITVYWPMAAAAQCLSALQDWLR